MPRVGNNTRERFGRIVFFCVSEVSINYSNQSTPENTDELGTISKHKNAARTPTRLVTTFGF
ncbi:MAG: hypothetical protein ACI87E_000471 [Mariniblastus sp.]|jgi:hypothetical protein